MSGTTLPAARVPAPLLLTRVATTATLLVLLLLFGTAGTLFPRGGAEDLHGTGAVLLHIFSGLTVLATFWLQRTTRTSWWPTALAAVVFGLGFVQASLGERESLLWHIPGAFVLSVGAIWLTGWSYSAHPRR